MKIIIIGAGITGLTLGAVCQRAGMDVTIYEKTKVLRNIGGGLLLWPHGLRYLDWLGLSNVYQDAYFCVQGCQINGYQGDRIFSESYADLYSAIDGEILPIDRHYFQQNLLKQVDHRKLILNKQCVSVVNEARQARVIFSDGTEDCADLVVGADGIHSAVKKKVCPTALQYTNYGWWGGIIEQKDAPSLSPHHAFIAMGLSKMGIVWPMINNRFMWYLPVKMPLTQFESDDQGMMPLQSLTAGWSREVQAIIAAPASAKRFHLPIYTSLPSSIISHRMVLMGDAGHAMGPILGQGTSQAIEDVFILFQCLQNLKMDVPDTLAFYQHLRLGRYQRFAELENQTAESMVHDEVASLEAFQKQIQSLTLIHVYENVIPLINKKACDTIAALVEPFDEALISSCVVGNKG